MSETTAFTPIDRATVVFEPDGSLRCSNCRGLVTDADADCPTCSSPIDWGASRAALRAWEEHQKA